MFGWIVDQSIIRYPQALTTAEIKNQLGISTQGAYNLKRRFQIFASEQQQKYKDLIRNDMKKLGRIKLPALGRDVKPWTSKYSIPHTDTMAVFSASQRCSKGRQRWKGAAKGNGQTSSIYMNSNLGGKQIGSLINTFSVPGRGLILDCIPNQEAGTIRDLLVSYLPRNTPVFSDEALKWYSKENKNHRMVNHSKRSKNKRYQYAKDRWSVAGVNIQSAEGTHSVLKTHLRTYRYIQPKHMPLYTNEFSFLRNFRVYGLNPLCSHHQPRVGNAEVGS